MMESRLAYVESIGTRKRHGERSSAYEADKQALYAACCIYNAHCRDEVQDGRSVTREWFARLRVIMGADWGHFSELDDLLAETRNG
ncbi:hypothetical protein A7X12_17635 [Sphingomonas sp. TDK1]|nr:hypothetical protein A7X12_17635 [Sphingomonas sp. TDK1]